MCGIVGMVGQSEVNVGVFDALTVLQHRGQDAAGIATCQGRRLNLVKGQGLVRDVFDAEQIRQLTGPMGIGHCRYPTAGSCASAEAQPFYVNSPYGLTLAHNGNLTNSRQLTRDLFETDMRHINTGSDSEVLLNVFARELQKRDKLSLTPDDIFDAVSGVYARARGGFAVTAMIIGYGVLGFRDPNGIRPLVIGKKSTVSGDEYMLASESVALDTLGYQRLRDVAPGECVFIGADHSLHSRVCAKRTAYSPCIFEHVYLARPDSILDGISVYQARLNMGRRLAWHIQRQRPQLDVDVVIPIPDTSRTPALALANTLEVPYREGFIKNRYIGRTFIMPGQNMRQKSVRQKLNPIGIEFAGKTVMLVDDSIVRGTTCRQITQMARDAGARKVYYASAAPPIRHPNVYGIDMPAATELIAHNRTTDDVAQLIGADWLIYQELEDLIAAVGEAQPAGQDIEQFDCSVFDGRYITGDIDVGYLTDLESTRNDQAKQAREATSQPSPRSSPEPASSNPSSAAVADESSLVSPT